MRINFFLAPLLLIAACADTEDDVTEEDCTDGHCDVFDAAKLPACKTAADFATTDGSLKCSPCATILKDKSGRGFFPAFTANDALVKKVYMTFVDKNNNKKIDSDEVTCPVSMPDIVAKLDQVDKNNCQGMATRVISETAAKLGVDKADYRAVTSRNCDNRQDFGLLFSSFGFTGDPSAKGSGVHVEDKGHPGEVEIIAFDQVDGVFNFYKEIGGNITFFGSSKDFVAAGPGGPGLTNTRGCANCHPGGGINMKELQSPWTHWAQEDNIQGADKLVQNRTAFMGRLDSGASMQFSVTQPGNTAWNKAKVEFLKGLTAAKLKDIRTKLKDDKNSASAKADIAQRHLKKGLNPTQTMLEPVFCAVQVNINNSGGGSSVPGQLFGPNRNGLNVGGTSFQANDLTAALGAIGSTVPGVGGNELTTPFMVVEESHEDEDYISQLVQAGVISQQFVQDVKMVDFTRPVMSDERCALLDLVPDLSVSDRNAAKVADAMIEALNKETPAAGSAAAQLLKHLMASKSGSPINHAQTLQTFNGKCSARPATEVLRDGLKMRSLQRQVVFNGDGNADEANGGGVHPFSVFEFAQTLPTDNVRVTTNPSADSVNQVSLDSRWNPNDCTLTTQYVAPN